MNLSIFDSHCHLDDRSYGDDVATVLDRARAAGVRAVLTVGTDLDSSRRAVALARGHESVFAAVGIHPHDAETCGEPALAELRRLSADAATRAWGEIGLDFNRMYAPREAQERCFARQLDMAAEAALPTIFHERDSGGRFLEMLSQRWSAQRSGVVHCFSGTTRELEEYLGLGLYIGITGIVTLRTRGELLRRQVVRIPQDRLLVETDAPYLTPTPERNRFRRNEPAFVRTVLFKLAEVRREEPTHLAKAVWNNTCNLFRINPDALEQPE